LSLRRLCEELIRLQKAVGNILENQMRFANEEEQAKWIDAQKDSAFLKKKSRTFQDYKEHC